MTDRADVGREKQVWAIRSLRKVRKMKDTTSCRTDVMPVLLSPCCWRTRSICPTLTWLRRRVSLGFLRALPSCVASFFETQVVIARRRIPLACWRIVSDGYLWILAYISFHVRLTWALTRTIQMDKNLLIKDKGEMSRVWGLGNMQYSWRQCYLSP